MDNRLSATLKDYLSIIFQLEQSKRMARSRDIAQLKKVATSTVTAALQSLARKELIHYEPYEPITLTSAGRQVAEDLIIRRLILTDFLKNVLGLEPKNAETAACQMEHAVEQEVLEEFICFLAFLNQYAPDGKRWLKEFRAFSERSGHEHSCQECIKKYLDSVQIKTETKREKR